MEIIYKNFLLSAAIGSLFTIITGIIINWLKRNRIKSTVKSFLKESISPSFEKIKKETKIVSNAINKYDYNGVTLSMYPTFNSSLLKTLPMTDLQAIYGKKFNNVINIIGYLDNLEKRLPHTYFENFVSEVEKHLEENEGKHENIYKNTAEHFLKCQTIEIIRNRTKTNLGHVELILEKLNTEIIIVTK